MATRREIRQAFESTIKTYAVSKGIPVAFENVKFTAPTVDAFYLKTFLLPAPDKNIAMCYGTTNNVGVFQIDIVSPIGVGTKQEEIYLEEISALFPEGQRIGPVRITRPVSAEAGVHEKDRHCLSLSVFYSLI